MFRLIFLFISLALFVLKDEKRKQIFFNTDYYKKDNRTGLSDFIRLQLRRKNAIKQCKKYFSKKGNSLSLRNDYIAIIYDSKEKTIKCLDKTIKRRVAIIEWKLQNSFEYNYIDNVFEETFDSVCALFNEKSNYDGIKKIFESQFIVKEIDNNSEEKIDNVNIPHKNKKLLNINSATEEELTDLPGLSIIHAKNIIRYREKNCGFGTLEEFFTVMKINSHFQNQLKYYLYVDTYTPPETKTTEKSLKQHSDILILEDSEYQNDERIVDI